MYILHFALIIEKQMFDSPHWLTDCQETSTDTYLCVFGNAVLQANEVFNMYSKNTDYTGVQVSARKPVAVYGGCDCVDIPDNSDHCDHIMEQVS